MAALFYTLLSVVVVSLVSFVGAASLFLKHRKLDQILLTLVSLSAGTLFGGAFLHLLPEAVEELGFTLQVSLTLLLGVVVFFLLEKIIHYHHYCVPEELNQSSKKHPHRSREHIGVVNLAGDGLHNFLDGLAIAGAYLVSIPVGIATTIAVILHEVPQELADFGVLLYAGYSKKKALLLNFLSAAVAILGAVIGIIFGSRVETFSQWILPFAAGGFLYIAGSNLIPELHKECDLRESVVHFIALLAGIGLMVALLGLE
ncbi:ZIP family metal transporter [Candidatus Woesearchaeota archaeon]|nr:ZIP family metal transporter [Candidatus Woesearchaeota archaeon]